MKNQVSIHGNLVKMVSILSVALILLMMVPVSASAEDDSVCYEYGDYVAFSGLSHWILSNNGRIVGGKYPGESNTELLDYQRARVDIPSFLRAKGMAKVRLLDGYYETGILTEGFTPLITTFYIQNNMIDLVSNTVKERVSSIRQIPQENVVVNQDTLAIASMFYDCVYGAHKIFSSDDEKNIVGFVEFVGGKKEMIFIGKSNDCLSENILGFLAAGSYDGEDYSQPKTRAVSNLMLHGESNWLISQNGRVIGKKSPCEDVEILGYQEHPQFQYPSDVLENGFIRYPGESMICLNNHDIGWTTFCTDVEIDIVWAKFVQDIVKYRSSQLMMINPEESEFGTKEIIAATVYYDENEVTEQQEVHATHIFYKSTDWRMQVGYIYFMDGSRATLFVGDFDNDGYYELGFAPGWTTCEPEPKPEPEKPCTPDKPSKPCEPKEPCSPCEKKHCIKIRVKFEISICY